MATHATHGDHYDALLESSDHSRSLALHPHHAPEHGGMVHHPVQHHAQHPGQHATHHPGHHPGHHVSEPVHEVHHHHHPQPPQGHTVHMRPNAPPPPGYDGEERFSRERKSIREQMRDIEHQRGKARKFPIGFESDLIPPGATTTIEVKPQVLFVGRRLAVPPQIGRSFDIIDVKVGKDSQLAASGNMPADAFSTLAVDATMELDPAEPGITIVLVVQNTGVAPMAFKAVMYGIVYE